MTGSYFFCLIFFLLLVIATLTSTISLLEVIVAATDYCIAKAGWSTVSEFVTAGVRTALLERDDTPEDTMTINQLKDRRLAISIKVDELKDIGKVIEKMDSFEWSDKIYENDYSKIADIIENNTKQEK